MRRRLLFVLLSTVVLALAVSGLGTYILVQRDVREREITRLSEGAQDLAGTDDVTASLDIARTALGLTSAAIIRFDTEEPSADRIVFASEKGLNVSSLVEFRSDLTDADLRRIAEGETVARVNQGSTWVVAPIKDNSGTFEALVLVDILPDTANRVVQLLGFGSLAALLLAAGSAFVISLQFTRPLRAATAAYRRIAAGDLTVRVADRDRSATRNDEVGELLRTLDTMAEALDRAKSQERQFLLSVSHDLRTPLTSIRGYAEALADGATDPVRSAEVIVNEARRLERLVQDLLDLAKLEARQFTLNPSDTDITDAVTDAADGFLLQAERLDIELGLEVEDGVRANIDRDRFAQVLANLIENSLKYARKQVLVTLTATTQTATIAVADDGPGIAPEDMPKVFDRSFTSDRRPTRHIGSGLGLAIVKELVETMNGTITVETAPTGTTFFVTIPRIRS